MVKKPSASRSCLGVSGECRFKVWNPPLPCGFVILNVCRAKKYYELYTIQLINMYQKFLRDVLTWTDNFFILKGEYIKSTSRENGY